jgi:hypothetical protein
MNPAGRMFTEILWQSSVRNLKTAFAKKPSKVVQGGVLNCRRPSASRSRQLKTNRYHRVLPVSGIESEDSQAWIWYSLYAVALCVCTYWGMIVTWIGTQISLVTPHCQFVASSSKFDMCPSSVPVIRGLASPPRGGIPGV